MAMLISLVNNLAPGTAMNNDIHFHANLCKSVIETWLESSIASTREMNFCLLSGRRRKTCKRESHDKEVIVKAKGWTFEANTVTQLD